MKKITSLLLTVVLLATMLTVFAVPAFAAGKEKVKVPSEVHLHYTGEELTAFEDTDKYTVYDAKKTNTGSYYAILTLKDTDKYEWESTNSSNSSEVKVSFEIHKSRNNENGYCRECGEKGNMLNIDYLERKVNDDNSVSTEEKTCKSACVITKGDTEWGVSGKSTWYVVNNVSDNVELENRPVVKGDVHIILKNFATLTANKGITVEEGGSISFYAQTDDESEMGKLTADTGDVTAIGSRNGNPVPDNVPTGWSTASSGENINGVYFYGGNILLKSTGACIGAGSGANGANNNSSGSNGGNVDEVRFCGGIISLESTGPCISGGNGGNGDNGGLGKGGARGGNGGNGGYINVHFYGGTNSLNSSSAACIAGGNGGNGGNSRPGGDGGLGGKTVVYFYGGENSLVSPDAACIAGGNGGNSGIDSIKETYFQGGNGGGIDLYFCGGSTLLESTNKPCLAVGAGGKWKTSSGQLNLNISGTPVMKAGTSAESTELINNISEYTYTNERYLSVQYESVSALGSILSFGYPWIVIVIAVLAIGGVAALVIVNKKKKPALAGGENTEE